MRNAQRAMVEGRTRLINAVLVKPWYRPSDKGDTSFLA
jgi:hypothetical protein